VAGIGVKIAARLKIASTREAAVGTGSKLDFSPEQN
jgi:hypothetical protein